MTTTLSEDGQTLIVRISMRLKTWGGKTEIIAPPGAPEWAPPPPSPHQAMLKALGRAHRWQKMLENGTCRSFRDLSEREGLDDAYIGRILRLTLLAPDIIEAILDGRQPEGLTLAALIAPLPMDWPGQRKTLGFPSVA